MNTCFTDLKFSITLFIFLVIFSVGKVAAQVELVVSYQNSFEKKLPAVSIPKTLKSLSELKELSTNLIQNLHNEGYWNAKLLPFAIDSLDKSNSKKRRSC